VRRYGGAVTIRITKLDVLMIALQLKEPFRFAYGTFHEIPRSVIRVEAEAGTQSIVGWGEAAIDFPFVPYDQLDIYLALSDLRDQLVGECVEDRAQVLLSSSLSYLRATPAAYCAVNMALDDVVARARGFAAGHLYGCTRSSGTPLCSVGFDQAADPEAWASAPGIIKIKVGQGLSFDTETIRLAERIAEKTGKKYALDFNATYALGEVLELLERLWAGRHLRLESCVILDWRKLIEVLDGRGRAPTVVADESFVSAAAGVQLAAAGIGLNYKIQKFGGILAAVEMENSIGDAAQGMRSFIGGTFPSPLGRAYDTLAGQVIQSANLPGDGLLPASTYLTQECADAFPVAVDYTGLGVRPDEAALTRLTVEDPVEEFYRIRTGRQPVRIKMDVGDSYAEKYARLSGRSPLWNIPKYGGGDK
jgi:L-alanine-DL-glutamate epimerase-like enolase superfamily enzyme